MDEIKDFTLGTDREKELATLIGINALDRADFSFNPIPGHSPGTLSAFSASFSLEEDKIFILRSIKDDGSFHVETHPALPGRDHMRAWDWHDVKEIFGEWLKMIQGGTHNSPS